MIVMGLFKEFSVVFISFTLHEVGHLFFLKLFNYKINKITIYPFGGVIDFINKPDFLYRYFFISIGGILVNFILLVFGYIFNLPLLIKINIIFIFFNLIPIYPLDGAKVLLCFMKFISPYYFAKKIIYYISLFLSLVFFIFLFLNLNAYIFLFFLLIFCYLNYYGITKFHLEYNNFLLSRHINQNNKLKSKKIDKFNDPIKSIYYGYNMLFDFDGFILKEEEVLNKFFKNKNENLK